jgi:hypothetical protein
MSDRVRTGEILAAIGAVGLSVLLAFGAWFSYDVVSDGARYSITGAVGARHLGWFAVFLTALAAIAGVLFLVHVFAAKTTDRPVLQAPVAFFAALVALLVNLVRMLVFPPEVTIDFGSNAARVGAGRATLPTEIATRGWLGLLAVLLLVVGTWIAMSDERKNTAAAHARTEALLGPIPVRPAPPVTTAPAPAADAAHDAVVDDASPPAPQDASSTGESA